MAGLGAFRNSVGLTHESPGTEMCVQRTNPGSAYYPVNCDPYRCHPRLSFIARAGASAWPTERHHRCERKWQVQRVPLPSSVGRRSSERCSCFPCPRGWPSLYLLGGAGVDCAKRKTRNSRRRGFSKAKLSQPEARLRERPLWVQHRLGLSARASSADNVRVRSACKTRVHLARARLSQGVRPC